MTAVDLKVSQSCVGSENHILRVERCQRDFVGLYWHVEALCCHIGLWIGIPLNCPSEVLDVGALDGLK